jgi:plasmid stabilization system protein ParE
VQNYRVRFTVEAQQDLQRLHAFLLGHNLSLAERAIEVIQDALTLLEKFSFSCRKAAEGRHGPRLRELIIPFGSSGYVLLFEIDDATTVTVMAVRHQRESDYH